MAGSSVVGRLFSEAQGCYRTLLLVAGSIVILRQKSRAFFYWMVPVRYTVMYVPLVFECNELFVR
jgi:hypothetical protein